MRLHGPAGFTLVELVVTVAIVSLLATMAMPLTQLVLKRAREQELRADLREIRDALDRYNELWRYSCQGAGLPASGLPGNPAAPGGPGAPAAQGAVGAPAANAFAPRQTTATAGGFGSGGAAGTLAGAGLGGAGGVDGSSLSGLGNGASTAPPPPPRMECPNISNGWPKDLQTLVDGVNNITSPTPGAKVYFLRRIPRDPMNGDSSIPAEQTWGRRSYASPPDDPQEGDDVYDVYSLSTAKDLTGAPYRDW